MIDPGLQEYQVEHHSEGTQPSGGASDQEDDADDADDDVEVARPINRQNRRRNTKWKGAWETLRTGLLSPHALSVIEIMDWEGGSSSEP